MAVPRFPLIILMSAFLKPGTPALILFFVIFGWPRAARLVRSQMLSERRLAYVDAAIALGAGDLRIIGRHLVPGTFPVLAVYAVMEFRHVSSDIDQFLDRQDNTSRRSHTDIWTGVIIQPADLATTDFMT